MPSRHPLIIFLPVWVPQVDELQATLEDDGDEDKSSVLHKAPVGHTSAAKPNPDNIPEAMVTGAAPQPAVSKGGLASMDIDGK